MKNRGDKRSNETIPARQPSQYPMQIRIYINGDGTVTITDLLDYMLPVAYALNPEDERLQGFMERI